MSKLRIWATGVAVVLGLASSSSAATYTWTGGGGANTNWSNPSNWGGQAATDDETGSRWKTFRHRRVRASTRDGDGWVTVAELIQAVGNALAGCPPLTGSESR